MSAPDTHQFVLIGYYGVETLRDSWLSHRWQEALNDLDQLLHMYPEHQTLYFCKGVCLYNLKRYDEAVIAYEQAFQKTHGFSLSLVDRPNVIRYKADALEKLGRSDEAEGARKYASKLQARRDKLNSLFPSRITSLILGKQQSPPTQASSSGSTPQHTGPTDAEKAAAQHQREEKMRNGQVSMPPDWHPPTHRDTGLPIGDIMMHGGQHTTPGHPRVLGPGGQPFAPPFQPGPGHGGRH